MRKINVDPESLIRSSNIIDDKIQNFNLLQHQLNDGVNTLQQAWSGKDNIAFTNQIKSYQNVIKSISVILGQYSDFLKNSANAYSQTQEELYSEALKMQG